MKIIIKQEISYPEIQKYLPAYYRDLIPTNAPADGLMNIVMFPLSGKVIFGRQAAKAAEKIDNGLKTLFFSYNFTREATELIHAHGGLIFTTSNFDWSDNDWKKYKNGDY